MENIKFDEATKRELTVFIEQQQAQAKVNQTIHTLTGTCWDKCITGTPSSGFSRSEQSCLANCVERFLDTSLHLVKHIEEKRGSL